MFFKGCHGAMIEILFLERNGIFFGAPGSVRERFRKLDQRNWQWPLPPLIP